MPWPTWGNALKALTAGIAVLAAFLPTTNERVGDTAHATLLAGPQEIAIKAGMGHGTRHAYFQKFKEPPVFPQTRGGIIMRFQVKFHPGFEWGCRGKLGGMFMGTGSASAFQQSKRGASHRIMWDAGGGAHAYVYVPKGSEHLQPPELSNRKPAGQEVWLRDFAGKLNKFGVWHTVELGVKLNSVKNGVPRADGKMMLRIGKLTKMLNKVVWRLYDDVAVEHFVISVFHGGPCKATRYSKLEVRKVGAHAWHA